MRPFQDHSNLYIHAKYQLHAIISGIVAPLAPRSQTISPSHTHLPTEMKKYNI